MDANDNGEFDPIWIAGLANSHPAEDVRDGLWGLMYDARPRGEA